MVKKKIQHPWYNFDKIFSYNAVINIVAGGRGIGKTYGAVKLAIKHALERDEQFIYLRRYKSETSRAKETIFSAVAQEYPSWDFRVNGSTAEAAHESTRDDKKREWTTIGYFVSLSNAQTQKSVSYPKVTKIIFDEFISEHTGSGRDYLANEATLFTNFYSTVDRYQDKTIALLLANSVSIMNPYFIEWQISPDEVGNDGWMRSHNGFIAAHFPDSAEFKASIYQTRFGKFIKDTEYADYAVENQFSDNVKSLVEKKDPQAIYIFTLETRQGTFSVWHNMREGEFYAQKRLPKVQAVYTTIPERITRDKGLMAYNDRRLQIIRTAFNQGHVTFDSPTTRNAFTDVFKR